MNAFGPSAIRKPLLTVIVMVMCLGLVDALLSFWSPDPDRLPEQYSAAYFTLLSDRAASLPPAVYEFGDSVLWGYKLPYEQTAASFLGQSPVLTGRHLKMRNVAFEGGSPANDDVVYRYLRSRGVRFAGVIVNINQKEFNPNDSSFTTLHPSIAGASRTSLTAYDRATLNPSTAIDKRDFATRIVEAGWRLYRLRVDIRERLFANDDAASAVKAYVQTLTGAGSRAALLHRPTAEAFEGTYDLTPIDESNPSLTYLKDFFRRLCMDHVPTVAFLTPTNHRLLHDYIDVPEYQANLRRTLDIRSCSAVHLVDFDASMAPTEFIDNDHLTQQGNQHLANLLEPELRRALR